MGFKRCSLEDLTSWGMHQEGICKKYVCLLSTYAQSNIFWSLTVSLAYGLRYLSRSPRAPMSNPALFIHRFFYVIPCHSLMILLNFQKLTVEPHLELFDKDLTKFCNLAYAI